MTTSEQIEATKLELEATYQDAQKDIKKYTAIANGK